MDDIVSKIKEELRNVVDPEIGYNIVELGLIYNIEVKDGKCKVLMSLTSPICPMGPQIIEAVKLICETVEGIKEAIVEVTFDPPWDPAKMAEDHVKEALGLI
ncbi:MAG: metal-sulfur cluster assembly factor [bacterium]|nr:metal-sulfur cluster assembly factor [bacterium]